MRANIAIYIALIVTAFPATSSAHDPKRSHSRWSPLRFRREASIGVQKANSCGVVEDGFSCASRASKVPRPNPSTLSSIVALYGTIASYILNNSLSFGPIQGSSVTGLMAATVLPPNLAAAAFCGSFAGMARPSVVPSLKLASSLGILCAVILRLFDARKWLLGVGGRLGFIAQCACTLQFLACSKVSFSMGSARLIGAYPSLSVLLHELPLISIFTIIGAFFMSLWREAFARLGCAAPSGSFTRDFYSRLSSSVSAVGATGIFFSLLVPQGASPAFCGAFIAMSSPSVLDTFGSLLGASIMGALCQQLMAGVLMGGWGGKLGTAALFGVLSFKIVHNASGGRKDVIS